MRLSHDKLIFPLILLQPCYLVTRLASVYLTTSPANVFCFEIKMSFKNLIKNVFVYSTHPCSKLLRKFSKVLRILEQNF